MTMQQFCQKHRAVLGLDPRTTPQSHQILNGPRIKSEGSAADVEPVALQPAAI